MNTEKYERTDLQITEFAEEDVIVTSFLEDLYELINPKRKSGDVHQTR